MLILSHPTWVRGLKPLPSLQEIKIRLSHPTWVRGLKPHALEAGEQHVQVAPHVGAWIETEAATAMAATINVAPHVGAWIETCPRSTGT